MDFREEGEEQQAVEAEVGLREGPVILLLPKELSNNRPVFRTGRQKGI